MPRESLGRGSHRQEIDRSDRSRYLAPDSPPPCIPVFVHQSIGSPGNGNEENWGEKFGNRSIALGVARERACACTCACARVSYSQCVISRTRIYAYTDLLLVPRNFKWNLSHVYVLLVCTMAEFCSEYQKCIFF